MPGGDAFAEALDQVPFVVATSHFPDETTARADLVLPTHTPLESWGDDHIATGLHGLMQPVMRPLYDTRHLGDVLLETTDPVAIVTLEKAVLGHARKEYPGYLDVRSEVYERAWRHVRETSQ